MLRVDDNLYKPNVVSQLIFIGGPIVLVIAGIISLFKGG